MLKRLEAVFGTFRPQLLTCFRRGYSRRAFLNDLLAGVIVGIVALPLAIAFGVASLGPGPDSVQRGLYTAIIAGFLISFFSGSRVQIGGPTGAFIVIVAGIVREQGIEGLLVATFLAGILLILMGFFGMGTLIKYIPYPVTLGFTSGIAVVIAVSQLQMFFGIDLRGESLPGETLGKLKILLRHAETINWQAFALAGLSMLIVLVTPWFSKRIPGALLAVIFGTLAVSLFGIPVDTIGKPLGGEPVSLQMGFPGISLPNFQGLDGNVVFRAAVTIAMLGAIESLLSAVVADSMIGSKHRSNTELIAQGIANTLTPLFGGIPATGAIARTAVNLRNGGRSPVAGMVHALVLLGIVLGFGKYAAMIPMPVLAGILIVVAINMSQYRVFLRLFRAPKSDVFVMICTFLLTVLLDLTIAIPVGLIIASFLFMHRMEQLFVMGHISNRLHAVGDEDLEEDRTVLQLFEIPDGVRAYNLKGPFFFGTTDKFQRAIDDVNIRVLVLRMRQVPSMDVSGLNALEELLLRAEKGNTTVLISGLRPQPLRVIERFGLMQEIGPENVHQTMVEAIRHAGEIVEEELRYGHAQRQVAEESNIFHRFPD